MRVLFSVLVVLGIAGGAYGLAAQNGFAPISQQPVLQQEEDAQETVTLREADRIVRAIRRMPGVLHQNAGKVPGKPGGQGVGGYNGDDSCQYANDGECDDPELGTGACAQGTDYSDCWRLATGVEDDSCQWAGDGECDEPSIGTGACTQATDHADCGDVAALRFQDDSCATAFDGICDEPGTGDGSCERRTDRADCIGRERPMQISDHFFGRDDRVFMDTSQLPWSVVGTITDRNGGSCTATLIGEDILITAAHCIEYENRVDATNEFRAGFDRPDGALSANVINFFLSPDREDERSSSEEPSNTDWALLRINQPLGRELGFVGVLALVTENGARQTVGTQIYQAGFSWDTGDHLSGNLACEILAVESDNKMAHNCDTTSGDSGSPFMVRVGAEFFVVGTDSTFRIEPNTPAVNIATRSDGWIDYVDDFAAGTIGSSGVTDTPEKVAKD